VATLPRLVLACVCLGLAVGCGKRETAAEAGIRTGTLLKGNVAEPKDLDPHAVTAQTDMRIILALFEGLTGIDERTGQPVPAGAQSWETSPDGLTWTFHLDPKSRWTNGEPVTAADYVYGWRRILHPAYAAEYAYMVYPLKNARAYNSGTLKDPAQIGAVAVDPLTLRLTLEEPCPWLLSLVAHQSWFPVHRASVEKFGGEEKQGTAWTRPGNLVGNGAFVLKEWQPNSRIMVERAPGYRAADQVKLQQIVFIPIESPATEEVAFRAGQLHVTSELPPDQIAAYRAETPSRLHADTTLSTFFIGFNVTKPPLDNVKVRRALTLAIDRVGISEKVLNGSRTPARSLVPANTAGYTSRTSVPDDYAAARTLLAEAGYPGGRGFPGFELQLGTSSTNRLIYEAIQETWRRELGINIRLAELEQKTLFSNAKDHNFQATAYGWIGDYVEANTFLELFLTNGGNNSPGWSNAEYDRLVLQSQRTADAAARRELQQQAEAILLAEAPIGVLLHKTEMYLTDSAVRGWTPALLGVRRYLNIELKK
jgi:oligopeptide transport system substrate-binding protein